MGYLLQEQKIIPFASNNAPKFNYHTLQDIHRLLELFLSLGQFSQSCEPANHPLAKKQPLLLAVIPFQGMTSGYLQHPRPIRLSLLNPAVSWQAAARAKDLLCCKQPQFVTKRN
jgi:hypothetical protein